MLGKLIVWSLLGLTTLACLAGCSAMMPTQNSAGTNYSWYVICVDGEAIGWSRTLETKEKKLYRTIIDTEMEIDSSREPAVIKLQHTFVESRDGVPLFGKVVRELPGEVSTIVTDYSGSEIVQTMTSQTASHVMSYPNGTSAALMPAKSRRIVAERIQEGHRTITIHSLLNPSDIEPHELTMTLVDQQRMEIGGEREIVLIYHVAVEGGTDFVQYRSSTGELVFESTGFGPGVITLLAVPEDVMREAIASRTGLSTPILLASADKPIDEVKLSTRVVFRLSTNGKVILPEVPTAGGQRVIQSGNTSVLVSFSPGDPAPAAEGDGTMERYSQPSRLIDYEDEAVASLSQDLHISSLEMAVERAHALSHFVYEYITDKVVDVTAGRASEVAKSQRGDSREHSVLLTALLRLEGISARIVYGLKYKTANEDGSSLFVPHTWTQALVDGFWVDLDPSESGATLHGGYIIEGWDTLEDAELHEPSIGLAALGIEIVEVEY